MSILRVRPKGGTWMDIPAIKGAPGADGKDGTSVTVKSVSESSADGGSNVVTFSDGKTLTVKNGSKGSKGDKGDAGADGSPGKDGSDATVTSANIASALGYTPADAAEVSQLSEAIEEIGTQEDIVQAVIAALGTPVFGTVDENKTITLKGDDLVSGTYTIVFEKANGTIVDIGTMAHTTYTNRIPLAIDTSGNIYNGTGYKAGYRLNSSAAETAYTAGTVTGFIPAVYGDTIYLKDVSFSPSFAEPGRLTLWGYDASFTPIVYGNLKAEAASGYVVDSAGNITQFPINEKMFVEKAGATIATTAADLANMKYFRITCAGITADSVITVNEPIV